MSADWGKSIEKGIKSMLKWKNREKMLLLMLQIGLYYKKHFYNSKSAAYKQEQLQIKSGLQWCAYGTWFENSLTQVTLVCNWPHDNNLVSVVHRAAAAGILNFFLLFLPAAFQKQLLTWPKVQEESTCTVKKQFLIFIFQ